MSTHNIGFYEEMRKIILKLLSNITDRGVSQDASSLHVSDETCTDTDEHNPEEAIGVITTNVLGVQKLRTLII